MATVSEALKEVNVPFHPLRAEVLAACRALGWSQNRFARRAGVNEGVFSRVLNRRMVSAPCERAARRLLRRLEREGKLNGTATTVRARRARAGQ
jgi:transcriptional regulator with XRE-family HTH domain